MKIIQTKPEDLPFAILNSIGEVSPARDKVSGARLRANDPCPVCHAGNMAYNGMLNLECERCGYSLGGCFT